MALTKVSAAMFSTAAQSSDMNMDDGTLFVDVSENKVGIGNTAPAEALDITGNLTLRSRGYLKLQDDTGGQFVALRAPATVSGSVTYTFPAADGSSGQSLTTDGSGTLAWSAAAPTAGTGVTVSGSQVSIGQAVATSSNVQFNSVKTTLIEYTDGDDAITIADGGHITAAGNVTVTGNLTVNGSTVTNSATNTTIEDLLIELGTGTSGSPASDAGLVLERGSSDNIFIGWDESADVFTVGTGSFTGASTGNLTHTAANAVFGSITGTSITGSSLTIDTATLVVDASNNRVGIGNASPDVSLDIGSYTDAVHVPVGTTGQRPGSPAAGYFRYNSTTSQFEGYTSAWGAIGGGSTTLNTDLFTGNGSTVDFTISQAIDNENKLMVFIDGVYQNPDAYSMPASTTLRFTDAPANSRKIAVYSIAGVVSGTNLNIDSFTGDGSDLTFTLSITPVNENNTLVYVGGVYQQKSVYSVSGTTLTFGSGNAPPNGASIEVATFNQTDINVPVDNTITTAKIVNDAVTADKIVDNIALPGNITTTGTLVPTGVLTANAGVVVDNITIDGTEIDLSSGDLTLDVAGKIILDADDPHIQLKDGGLLFGSIYAFGSDLHIKSEIQDEDIIFQGNDGGSAINALILDMSEAGKAIFGTGGVQIGDSVGTGYGLTADIGTQYGAIIQTTESTPSANPAFWVKNDDDGSISTLLRVQNNGNVGIGNNDTLAKALHIVKDTGVTHNGIRIDNTTSYYGQLEFFTTGGSRRNFVQSSGAAHLELGSDSSTNGEIHFYTNGAIRAKIAAAGTTTFEHPIVVQSGATQGYYIENNAGNAVTPRITNDANDHTVIRPGKSGGAVQWNNFANTAELMRLDDSGRLGIGAAPEAWSSTWEVLQVGATGAIISQNGDALQLAENSYNDGSGWKAIATGSSSFFSLDNGGIQMYTAPSVSADANQTFSYAMNIDNNGRVTKPSQPYFQANGNGAAWASVTVEQQWNTGIHNSNTNFWNQGTDRGGDYFDPTTGRFTCPVTGWYQFTFSLYAQNSSASAGVYCHPQFFKQGVLGYSSGGKSPYHIVTCKHTGTEYIDIQVTENIYCVATNYVEVKIYWSATSSGTWRHYPDYAIFTGGLIS